MSVLEKAAQVVESLTAQTAPVRLGALAADLGLPKSSTHRLLSELCDLGLARRHADGSYSVGYRLVQWGQAAERAVGIRTVAEPVMRTLSQATSENVHLHVPEGDHRVCLAVVEGPHTLRPVVRPGEIRPLARYDALIPA